MLKNSFMDKLIIPEKLQRGDTIGFVSPSAGLAPFAMHRIDRAKECLEGFGYKVKIAKNALKNMGYVSTTVNERISDIHEMFSDKEVRLIMSTIGGNHCNQLLKYIDYDLVKKNPKIFVGYSDITVLHLAFNTRSNLATYYGPCVMTQFGENPKVLEYTLEYFLKSISKEKCKNNYKILPSEKWTEETLNWFEKKDLSRPRRFTKNEGYEWLTKGKAKGELFGGCLLAINRLAGTKYWPSINKNCIFFIDIPEGHSFDTGMQISDVDAYLADLDNMGVFESIQGLIVGRPFCYSKKDESELKKVIEKYFKKRKCPIIYNVNIGHTDPIATLRYGAVIELDSSLNQIRVLDS